MALINTERPLSFDRVKGQENIVRVLTNDLTKKNIKGAYLFEGTRGTGKTTVARIFARALNCEHPNADGSPCNSCKTCKEILDGFSVDVLELDAASNNSVDNVRDLIQKVMYKPIHVYKVVIMDEVHMLSTAAFNALLKTLEEPPQNVVFILCTTEKHKVPATIVSRCACHTFEKISYDVILSHLKEVCDSKNIRYDSSALGLIAKAANGGMRDALSILDNFTTMDMITAEAVASHLGITDDDILFNILSGIADKNALLATDAVDRASAKGASLSFLVERIFEVLLDIAEFQATGDLDVVIGTESYRENLMDLSVKLSTERVFEILDEFRKIYQSRNDSLQFSFISSILGVIYKDNAIETLRCEVAKLRDEVRLLKESGVMVSSSPVITPALAAEEDVEPSPAVVDEDVVGDDFPKEPVFSEENQFYDEMAFEYQEEMPDFDEPDVSAGIPVEEEPSVLENSPSEPAAHVNTPAIAGISFEELAKMDGFTSAEGTPFEDGGQKDASPCKEDENFLGNLFTFFPRRS